MAVERARVAPQPLHFAQDGVQSVPADELHGVVVKPLVLADAEDRHDVGMVQPGRRAGLAPEPFQPGRVAQVMEGERLQSDVPPQRFLDRLVHDPHAASSDAPEQEVVTQALGRRGTRAGRVYMRAVRLASGVAELFHDEQCGKNSADSLGQLGMLVRVFAERRPLAFAVPRQEFFGQIVDRIKFARGFVHGRCPLSPSGERPTIRLSREIGVRSF